MLDLYFNSLDLESLIAFHILLDDVTNLDF